MSKKCSYVEPVEMLKTVAKTSQAFRGADPANSSVFCKPWPPSNHLVQYSEFRKKRLTLRKLMHSGAHQAIGRRRVGENSPLNYIKLKYKINKKYA